MTDLPSLRETLDAHGLSAKKSFGQHFLLDLNVTRKIVRLAGPFEGRAVIDAGSKVLTSDLLGLDGHGHVLGRPDIHIAGLSEEHGVLTADAINLQVGDRLRIIPNHVCVVTNMLDEVQLIRGSEHLGPCPVAARGQVW